MFSSLLHDTLTICVPSKDVVIPASWAKGHSCEFFKTLQDTVTSVCSQMCGHLIFYATWARGQIVGVFRDLCIRTITFVHRQMRGQLIFCAT